MFHVKEGWFFERMEDGKVRVYSPKPDIRLEMDPDTWASVLASMSARGDSAEAFQDAQDFHNKEA